MRTCPICQKRKATRACPARAETICTVCCATEREVTIDCPAACEYLIASRHHDDERREVDWSTLPFPEAKIHPSFLNGHRELLDAFAFAISEAANRNHRPVDRDALAALQALAEAYRALANGLYYENPPHPPDQRDLYDALKVAIDDLKKLSARASGIPSLRDSEIRDGLIAMTQIGHLRTNHRPKGRAFLDFLRRQFPEEDFGTAASKITLLP